jgi:subtilisin-like proprotein convertase family protein
MNRRHLLLAGFVALPAAALPWPIAAQRPATGRRRANRGLDARRRHGGGLTASSVRTRIVTRTFTSTAPVTIPAGAPGTSTGLASPYPSTILVRGLPQGRIRKVRVTLMGLTHSSPDDLDVMVVAPGNVGVVVLSDIGGTTDVNGITVTFDQDAPARVPEPLTSGTFQPLNNRRADDSESLLPPAPQSVTGHSLTRFSNRNPNGVWRLFVANDGTDDSGSLAGWALQIRAKVRVPHQHRRRGARRRGQGAGR